MNGKAWAHGLGSAFITGASSALGAAIIQPDSFNIHAGWKNLLSMAVWSGIIGAAAYLKSSPLPAIKADIESQKGN